MINKDAPELNHSTKYIFDEIAAELADALRNVRQIERGVSKTDAKNLAFHTAGMIRRAGKICAHFGIRANGYLEAADLDQGRR